MKTRVPVAFWAVGAVVLVIAILLLLPNGSTRRIREAELRLKKDFALTPRQELSLSKVMGDRIVYPGERKTGKIWHVWRGERPPKLSSSLLEVPEFSRFKRSGAINLKMGFDPDSLIVAPIPHPDAETFGLAFLLWGNQPDRAGQLDLWRRKYGSPIPNLVAQINAEIAKEDPKRVLQARNVMKRNQAAIGSLPDGFEVFIDARGRRFGVKKGFSWDFENIYQTANPDQPPN